MDQDGNTEVLLRIWDRRDKDRDLNVARKDRAAERAEDRKRSERDRRDRLRKERAEREERDKARALRLHLAEMAANARERERKAKAEGAAADTDAMPDLSKLTPEQLASYREIARVLTGGDDADSPA